MASTRIKDRIDRLETATRGLESELQTTLSALRGAFTANEDDLARARKLVDQTGDVHVSMTEVRRLLSLAPFDDAHYRAGR